MILIADGGSTKVDWIALNANRKEVFRVKSLGLNPAVVSENELQKRILAASELITVKEQISEIHFYGAGCGTPIPVKILKDILESIFIKAKVVVAEDMLAAVYATSGEKPAIVCILGTGSNSCFFDGENLEMKTASLGYTIMDEASGNYFGKILLRDFYYETMPKTIATKFKNEFNLDVDTVKFNLYRQENPNMYLAGFAKFMFEYKDEKYIRKIIKKGFKTFFKYRILPLKKPSETQIYFIGSIAFYFRDILEVVANKYGLKITGIIQRPIDNLVKYHKEKINR
ncbi:N-acetylglucosamine kinase [Polaribacter uvawellassae]|uniref:N-acetylglucosamine kinase n=1 Tax=Polaribacter uvawellassae TaxID=3133495 RepID=UPI00321A32EC